MISRMQPELVRYIPEIATERLLIRPLQVSDEADVFAYARDPEVARHWRREEIASTAALAALIVVMHATRYAIAVRRITRSSLNECAPADV